MSHNQSLEKMAVRSEHEILAASTYSTDLLDALEGRTDLLDPWTHFAILEYEQNGDFSFPFMSGIH